VERSSASMSGPGMGASGDAPLGTNGRDPHAAWPRPATAALSDGEDPSPAGGPGRASWTLLSNHGLALLVIAGDPSCRVCDVADILGITERAAIKTINDLVNAGYVARRRIGRRNTYAVDRQAQFRHPALRWQRVQAFLRLMDPVETDGAPIFPPPLVKPSGVAEIPA
jgi:hypothetical protein